MDKYDRLHRAIEQNIDARADVEAARQATNLTNLRDIKKQHPHVVEAVNRAGEQLFSVLMNDFGSDIYPERFTEDVRDFRRKYARTRPVEDFTAEFLRQAKQPDTVILCTVAFVLMAVVMMPYDTRNMPSFERMATKFRNVILR